MPSDIKLDTSTWDYDLSSNGLEVFTETSEVVAQRVRIALQIRKGEIFYDTTNGIPISDFSTSRDGGSFADAYMLNYVSEIEGVDEVLSFSSEYDASTRYYKTTIELQTTSGDIVTIDGDS